MKARMIRDMHRVRKSYPLTFENIFLKVLYHKNLTASAKRRYLQALLNVVFSYDIKETGFSDDCDHLACLFYWNSTREGTKFWVVLSNILAGYEQLWVN